MSWWVEGDPAAPQPPGGLAGVGVQEPLELFGVKLVDGQPVALVDGAAEVAVLVLVVVVGVVVPAHVLLPSASAR
jgi:hypothetical protein